MINVVINSLQDVEVNGVPTSVYVSNNWVVFTIATIDTTASDFLTKIYQINWTNTDQQTSQHGGYLLDYDGFTGKDSMFERNGGPIWWWYSPHGWRAYEDTTTINVPAIQRSYNQLLIQFTSTTTWRVSRDDGVTWYTINSLIGTFPDTIQFCYKMHNSSLTNPHSFVFFDTTTRYLQPFYSNLDNSKKRIKYIDLENADDLTILISKEYTHLKQSETTIDGNDSLDTLNPSILLFNFNLDSRQFVTDVTYVLFEYGNESIGPNLVIQNKNIYFNLFKDSGNNTLFYKQYDIGLYDDSNTSNLFVLETSYISDNEISIKIYFNNSLVVNETASTTDQSTFQIYGGNTGGIGTSGGQVDSRISSFQDSYTFMHHANFYILNNSYIQLLSHNNINYIQNRFTLSIANTDVDITNDNILFHTENEVQKPFYMVKVVSDNGNKYQFNDSGTSAETIQLVAGNIYLFDQSHSSNSGHPLLLSETSNGTHGGGSEYTTGVTIRGTPGSSGAFTKIHIPIDAPTLYYYCFHHSNMGGQINISSANPSNNIVFDHNVIKSIDTTDLQFEYIASNHQDMTKWCANYDNSIMAYNMTVNSSEWELNNDSDGYYYKKLNGEGTNDTLNPNYLNITHTYGLGDITPDSSGGIMYEIWLKLDETDTISSDSKYWIMGTDLSTHGLYIALNDDTIGGIGITSATFDSSINYIDDSPNHGNLLHLVGYSYPLSVIPESLSKITLINSSGVASHLDCENNGVEETALGHWTFTGWETTEYTPNGVFPRGFGGSEYVKLGSPSELGMTNGFTFSFWLWMDEAPNINQGVQVHVLDSSLYGITADWHGMFSMILGYNSGGGYIKINIGNNSIKNNPSLDTWYHIAMVVTSSNATAYVDGTSTFTRTNSGAWWWQDITDANYGFFTFGDDGTSTMASYPFRGQIKNVRIYESLLTASEIANIYSAGIDDVLISSSSAENVNLSSVLNYHGIYINGVHHLGQSTTSAQASSGLSGNFQYIYLNTADMGSWANALIEVKGTGVAANASRLTTIRELQVWVDVNGTSTNVATAAGGAEIMYVNPSINDETITMVDGANSLNNSSITKAINGNFGTQGHQAVPDGYNIGAEYVNSYSVLLKLPTTYNSTDLQSIVVYSRTNSHGAFINWNIKILDENQSTLYETAYVTTDNVEETGPDRSTWGNHTTNTENIYRFDTSSLPTDLLVNSGNSSTTGVINTSGVVSIVEVINISTNTSSDSIDDDSIQFNFATSLNLSDQNNTNTLTSANGTTPTINSNGLLFDGGDFFTFTGVQLYNTSFTLVWSVALNTAHSGYHSFFNVNGVYMRRWPTGTNGGGISFRAEPDFVLDRIPYTSNMYAENTQIAITYDTNTNTFTVFVNGEEAIDTAAGTSTGVAERFTNDQDYSIIIGNLNSNTSTLGQHGLRGTMQYFKFFPSILTASQIGSITSEVTSLTTETEPVETINFKYQPYDYTLSGNENFYVTNATYLYNFYIDTDKSEYNDTNFDFIRISLGLNDPNNNNSDVNINSTNSGYISINESLTTVTGGTSLNSNDPYYFKVANTGGSNSLLYKTNGYPITNPNINVSSWLTNSTDEYSHHFALSFDSTLTEDSILLPVHAVWNTQNHRGSKSSYFMTFFSADTTKINSSSLRHYDWNQQLTSIENIINNATANSTNVYLYALTFNEAEPEIPNVPEDIPNVPEDITYSTPQDIGTFSEGTSISITDSLSSSDDPNTNISYTFALSKNIVITELNFTVTNYSDDYINFYYVIQENTSSIIKQSNNTLQENNLIESEIVFSNGTKNLLNVGNTTVELENSGEEDKQYVLIFYILVESENVYENSGRLTRYTSNYSGGSYTNTLPAWNYFGSATLQTQATKSHNGNYFTNYWDGYIYYETNTTLQFGIVSDDDSFVWIIKGDRKWSSIGHSNGANYTWIVSNISDATLVCGDPGKHGVSGTYGTRSGISNSGSYTFEANTLYTILFKMSEAAGGEDIYFAVREGNSWNGQSRTRSTFPSEFFTNLTINSAIQGSVNYNIESNQIIAPATNLTFNFEPPSAASESFKYVKLSMTDSQTYHATHPGYGNNTNVLNGNLIIVFDLKIFINDVDVATSASLSRSTDAHGRVVTNMTDGNDSTMYHSDFVSDENWVLIELDSTYSLNDLQAIRLFGSDDDGRRNFFLRGITVDILDEQQNILNSSIIPITFADGNPAVGIASESIRLRYNSSTTTAPSASDADEELIVTLTTATAQIFRIGNTSNSNYHSQNIKLYAFRVWHKQLSQNEINFLYSHGPQYSASSIIHSTNLMLEYVCNSNTITTWTPTFIYGISTNTLSTYNLTLNSTYHENNYDVKCNAHYILFKSNNDSSVLNISLYQIDTYENAFNSDSTHDGIMYEAWVHLENTNTITSRDSNGHLGLHLMRTTNGAHLILNNTEDGNGNIGMYSSSSESSYPTFQSSGDSFQPGNLHDSHFMRNCIHIVGYMKLNTLITYDRGVYINGEKFEQTTTSQNNPSFTNTNQILLYIGENCENLRLYSFRVWHRQLSQREINVLYNAGPSRSVFINNN